jgi:hypothetical protein
VPHANHLRNTYDMCIVAKSNSASGASEYGCSQGEDDGAPQYSTAWVHVCWLLHVSGGVSKMSLLFECLPSMKVTLRQKDLRVFRYSPMKTR